MGNEYDWQKQPRRHFPYIVGSKRYVKERNAFFKKNGGKGFEYHGWWYVQGHANVNEKYFLVNEKKTK